MDKKELMEFALKDLKEMFANSKEYISVEMYANVPTIFSVKNIIPSTIYDQIINSGKLILCGTVLTNDKIRIDIILTDAYIEEIKRKLSS